MTATKGTHLFASRDAKKKEKKKKKQQHNFGMPYINTFTLQIIWQVRPGPGSQNFNGTTKVGVSMEKMEIAVSSTAGEKQKEYIVSRNVITPPSSCFSGASKLVGVGAEVGRD